jgi:ribonuclease-3
MSLEALERKIGYVFQNKNLLRVALTHSTYAEKYGMESNERMEYLGDSVLQLVVSEKQYFEEREKAEGVLTKERQRLVCLDALYKEADKLGLKKYLLFFGKWNDNIGKKTVSSLYETLVAAIYLDGGYQKAKTFVLTHYPEESATQENYKSALQEYLQKRALPLPVYKGKKEGKAHAPVFFATVEGGGFTASGQGSSEKKAEQQAAKALIEILLKTNG